MPNSEQIPIAPQSPEQPQEAPSAKPRAEKETKIETQTEKFPRQEPGRKEKIIQAIKASLGKGGLGGSTRARVEEKKHQKEIEDIMSKNLEEIYAKLPEHKQQEFKIKGEETARKIDILMHKTKVKLKKITKLIRKWLSIIPGVNKFFLEQSSKIKADEIVKLKQGW